MYLHITRKPASPRKDAMAKYEVNIEGTIHPWEEDTITLAQLRALGGFAADQEMIEVDLKDNSETVLAEDAVVKLKPGQGFAKKVEFKRG
jgi:hypothetical protein